MMDCKETFCRLCLNNIGDTNSEIIDYVVKNVLRLLLPKLTFDDRNQQVICKNCVTKLMSAFEFKQTCVNTDNTIVPYLNCDKALPLDLSEIYMKEKENNDTIGLLGYQKICRLCMQLIKDEYIPLQDEEFDSVQKFIPEINFGIIKNPVICKQCSDSVDVHNSFLTKCLNVGKGIENGRHNPENGKSEALVLDLPIKTENIDVKNEREYEMWVKPEYVEIKSEVNAQKSDTFLFVQNVVKPKEEPDDIKTDVDSLKTNPFIHTDQLEVQIASETQKSPSCTKIYKCDSCDHETKRKGNLKRHQLIHRNPWEVQMYKCETCDYQTKFKSDLPAHRLKHKTGPSVAIYKCEQCDFETKYRVSLTYHLLQHKDPSDVLLYKCDECDYKTKRKGQLTAHQRRHKSPSEVRMYKCENCAYQSMDRSNFLRHQSQHEVNPDARMYTCDECRYQTRCKSQLKHHQLKHRSPSEVRMYKCDKCKFQSKYRSSFVDHLLKHKDPSEVRMYKCEECDYETKRKGQFKSHQLRHKDLSEVQLYKCDQCEFQTKHKSNLPKHLLRHKMPTEGANVQE